ncbi:uncharacterized protein [Primulina huaijiensis]|uniref:uncharacterized protein n=1 Tax=Primulina huaijiensis TaxID=1492673 RepID=UPI003CC77060
MTTYLKNVGEERVIVILQMCRAKKLRGEIRISNVYHITNLVVNGDLDEITEFRKRLVNEINTPKTISTISLASTNTILEELSKNNIRSIGQISEDKQVGSFWVFANIGVDSSCEWSYLSRKKFPKKVTPVGDKFYCERFKIHLRVVDNTGNVVFLLWDRECVGLIGKTAIDLRNDVKEEVFVYLFFTSVLM